MFPANDNGVLDGGVGWGKRAVGPGARGVAHLYKPHNAQGQRNDQRRDAIAALLLAIDRSDGPI